VTSAREKREQLARLLEAKLGTPRTFPLSYPQERLWFLDQLQPGSSAYNIASATRISSALDPALLERSFNEIIRRHTPLRSVFAVQNGKPVQRVLPQLSIAVGFFDLSGLSPTERERRAREQADSEALAPFDLETGPLLRVGLIRLAPADHLLLLTFHHIVIDGWSFEVLMHELDVLYRAFALGEQSPLPPLPLQYADWARWQRERMSGELLESQLVYWRGALAGAPPLVDLPADRPRPARQSGLGASHHTRLGPAITQRLFSLGRTVGATPFMIVLAGFAAALARWSGEPDLVIGTPIANRMRAELENLIGLFINTLALRIRVEAGDSFATLVRNVREATLGAFAHQELPFERLVEELHPIRDLGYSPLFQVMFVLQSQTRQKRASGAAPSPPPSINRSKFDLSLNAYEHADGVDLLWEYATDLFDRSTIARLATRFEVLLDAACANADRPLEELPFVDAVEADELARSAYVTSCIDAGTVVDALAIQFRRTPDAAAVVCGLDRLDFAMLATRAVRLAARLRAIGAAPERPIALCVDRSIDLVVGLVAILQSGATYLPLDPTAPHDRLAMFARPAQPVAILTQQRLVERIRDLAPVVVLVDNLEHGDATPLPQPAPEHLAYIAYSSRAAGRSAGVQVEHGALLHYLRDIVRRYGLCPSDRVLAFASVTYDAAVEQLLAPLIVGATVVVRGEGEWSASDLARALVEHGVTTLTLTVAHWNQVTREWARAPERLIGHRLRLVVLLGDGYVGDLRQTWERLAPFGFADTRIVRVWGPTETVIGALFNEIARGEDEIRVVRGRALGGKSLHVIDPTGRLAPMGVPGELCVGGELARGYLGEPDLTGERFVPDPYGTPGSRRFRTGERARRRADGTVEVLGLLNRRVRVGGFPVELDAIEAALVRHPDVRDALALVRGPRVLAYVVPRAGTVPGAADLRRVVAEQLPSFMVPAAFVIADRLPDRGDRHTLPSPADVRPEDVAPSPIEARLAAIWAEVLGLPRVGVHDNFFDLGGHSLTATQVVARIRDAFDLELPLRALFESPTIAELAIHVGSGPMTSGPPLRRLPREADPPLSFAQERLWFLDQFQPGSAGYNIPFRTHIARPVDYGVLVRALAEVVRRHEALRTTFPIVDGRPVQRIHRDIQMPFELVDVQHLPAARAIAEAARIADEEARTPFDLARGPLLRAKLVRVGKTDNLLLLTAHHIVADGWSFDVLTHELNAIYDAFLLGDPSPLPELPLQYADWSQWQRLWLRGERLDAQLAYWRDALLGAPPVLELPTDHPRPVVESVRGATHGFWLRASLRRGLEAIGQVENATPFMTLLAGFAALLQRWSGQSDIVIGSPIANRTHAVLENLIGFLVNTLALRVIIRPDDTFRTLVRRVREMTLGGYVHQDLPFERLVEELRPERNLSRNPIFQVMFVMQNTPGDGVSDVGGDDDRAPQPAPPPGGTSKFDLSLFLTESGQRWLGGVEYNAVLFEPATIISFERRLLRLLAAVADAPDAPLANIAVLEADESQRVRAWSRGPEVAKPPSVTERILWEVARHPDAPAVIGGDRMLTYATLADRARGIAGGLARLLSTRDERRVGLCVARTTDAVAALLGIMLAGAAYVPLDPSYPAERLRFMIEDGRPALVLSDATGGAAIPGVETLALDELLAVASPASTSVADVAYVIYTSGSTGKPKGIAMPHDALAHLIDWQVRRSQLPPGARTAQLAPWSFDVSFQEIFATLGAGGCLVLFDDETRRDPALLLQALTSEQIARVFLPPVALRALAEFATGAAPAALREIITAGEALVVSEAIARLRERSPQLALFNQYGPTETHVVTEHRVEPADGVAPPIGRPLPGVIAHVLDPNLSPVPEGWLGELYIGGVALARGYVHRPALTADRFVPDPFGRGTRIYRTGDRARWRSDGTLEFLGRADEQVKVRGFRVEPAEVEAVLEQHPAIASAAVTARGEGALRALCAYIVPRTPDIDLADIRRLLRGHVPDYLVPSSFTVMPSLPRTPSGKLDRRALPAPAPLRGGDRGKVLPSTPVEITLAAIWSEVLGTTDLSVHDNFFELGGHSLLATQVVARARARFGVELPLRRLFEQPTIAGLAIEIVHAQLVQAEADAVRRLSQIERLPDANVRVVPAKTASMAPWLLGHRPDPNARVRLICFPYAGGSATVFHDWRTALPPTIDICAVQLPGRQSRLAEPPFTELAVLVDACATALRPLADLPWALFGHSFGGLIAFELARCMRNRGTLPCHLFVAAVHAPHLPPREPLLHALPLPDLLAELDRLGGTPPELLAHRELIAEILPALRADLAMCEKYRLRPEAPLDCPVSAFGGIADPFPDRHQLAAWQQHARGAFRLRMLAGGHFFLDAQRPALMAAFTEDLAPWTR
jgi:amino acid adenylation domain-containing protein